MKRIQLPLAELGAIAATRGMLGAGVALLLSGTLSEEQRRKVGWSLALVGAVSTIPLAVDILGKRRSCE